MLARFQKKIHSDERGITGLETAIILIAFVMVASVFAYVVLSAGLFSSQKAKQSVNAALSETKSTVMVKGDILAEMVDDEGTPVVNKIYFTVGSLSGSDPIDFTDTQAGKNVVTISYSDAYQQFPALPWQMVKVITVNDDNLLDENEFFQIIVDLSLVNHIEATPTPIPTDTPTPTPTPTPTSTATPDGSKVGRYHQFALQLKPPTGAVLTIERTIPAKVSKIINLY
jgi:archaeal flagellin FlaB